MRFNRVSRSRIAICFPCRGVAGEDDRESRAELLGLIKDHAIGRVPLVVPLTLFCHHIRKCGVPYLADQVYLRPHPVELMLRNHV